MADLIRRRTPVPTVQANKPVVRRSSAPAASRPAFIYTPPTTEELRERALRRGSRDSFFTQDVQFYTPKVGDNVLRILPPPPDKRAAWRSYGVVLYIHYGIGVDEGAYLCLDKMKGDPCPVCEERTRAKSEGEDDLAQALRPTGRVAVYVVDRDQEGKGPLIWNMPPTLDSDICGLAVDKKSGEIYPVDNPDAGYDITFSRTGQGMLTKYSSIQIDRRPSPLSEDPATAERWLAYVCDHPLDEKLVFHDTDHIRATFGGGIVRRDAKPSAAPSPATGAAPPRTQLRAPAAASAAAAGPTYAAVQAMTVDEIGALGGEFGLEFPETGFGSLAELRTWACEQLQLDPPAAPSTSGAKSDWRTRLANLK